MGVQIKKQYLVDLNKLNKREWDYVMGITPDEPTLLADVMLAIVDDHVIDPGFRAGLLIKLESIRIYEPIN